jgi:hypothetical protein
MSEFEKKTGEREDDLPARTAKYPLVDPIAARRYSWPMPSGSHGQPPR